MNSCDSLIFQIIVLIAVALIYSIGLWFKKFFSTECLNNCSLLTVFTGEISSDFKRKSILQFLSDLECSIFVEL